MREVSIVCDLLHLYFGSAWNNVRGVIDK